MPAITNNVFTTMDALCAIANNSGNGRDGRMSETCIDCNGVSFAVTEGVALFGIADIYADYTYHICLNCGLRVGYKEC